MEEIWKDVVGYEKMYQVSSNGNVKSLSRPRKQNMHGGNPTLKEKLLRTTPNNKGYIYVSLFRDGIGERFQVHRLVLKTFSSGSTNNLEVNHKNGIPSDNRLENLEWVTRSENQLHSYRVLGNKNACGEKQWLSKLTDKKVLKMRALRATNPKKWVFWRLAKRFGISTATAYQVVSGKSWKHLP